MKGIRRGLIGAAALTLGSGCTVSYVATTFSVRTDTVATPCGPAVVTDEPGENRLSITPETFEPGTCRAARPTPAGLPLRSVAERYLAESGRPHCVITGGTRPTPRTVAFAYACSR